MVTKTIDSIAREALIEEGLTMHFYVWFLLHALSELQRLGQMHGVDAKQVQLSVNGYSRVAFPEDLTQLIDVSLKNGERLLPMVKDASINKLYNFDGAGNKIDHPDASDGAHPIIVDHLDSLHHNRSNHGFGGWFGLNAPQDKTFNVDYTNREIVFSNQFEGETVVLTYAVDPVSTSAANLVRYEFIDTIKSYIKWKFLESSNLSNQYEIESAKNQYHIRKRNMKAMIYPMNRASLMYNIRKGIHAGQKN